MSESNPGPSFQADAVPVDLGATIHDDESTTTISEIMAEGMSLVLERGNPGQPGQGRYVVEQLIGKGATSQIYAVKDTAFDRRIAIKFLHGSTKDDQVKLTRFMREARLTAALEHPNIAPIYDLDVTSDGALYFSMRMITGISLGDAMKKHSSGEISSYLATPNDIVNMLLRVCEAISCAHGQGILHRDIKPDNIMLGGYGEVMLVDWGSALVVGEDVSQARRLIGTPNYMSPEQARAEPADERSDIYALGATLFQVLVGRVPTIGANPQDFWEKKHLGELVPPNAHEREGCPPRLLDIARKALQGDPDHRYQKVSDLADDLRRWQSGLAVSAHQDSPLERMVRWHRRHWQMMWGAVLVVGVILGSASVMYGDRLKEIARWGAPILEEDFSDESWNQRWQSYLGGFSIQDGALVTTGSAANIVYFSQRLGGGVAIEYDASILPDSLPGDVSIVWCEKEISKVQSELEAGRFCIQVGAFDNSYVQIYEENKRIAAKPMRLDPGRWYRIRVEIESEYLSVIINGEEVVRCGVDVPTGNGYFGLYGYYAGKAFDNIRVYTKGIPERVSSLAFGDRDLRKGAFADAALQYREVALAHPGKPIGEEALYKEGYAWRLQGDDAQAEMAWSRLADTRLRQLADIQRLYIAAKDGNYDEVWSEIRRLDRMANGDSELHGRLARLWADVADGILTRPRLVRETACALFRQHFSEDEPCANSAARLLRTVDAHAEVLERFPYLVWESMDAYRALGRMDEVPIRFPLSRARIISALVSCGRFEEVLAMNPTNGWVLRVISLLKGETLDQPIDQTSRLDDISFYVGGKSQWIVDHRSDSAYRMRALLFLNRLQEVVAIPVDSLENYRQKTWQQIAKALAGDEAAIRLEREELGERFPVWLQYWLVVRALADGNRALAMQELQAIPLERGWYDDTSKAFSRGLLQSYLAFLDGDRAPFAAQLADIAEHRRWVFTQQLWYCAEYIAGHLTDEEFLEQPVVIYQTGSLALCRAMRAEWEGRLGDAEAAYQAYLALPPPQRLVFAEDRDPVIEAFAAWRVDALKRE